MRNIIAFTVSAFSKVKYSLRYISLHLERANYMHKPYALVNRISKESLQPMEGVIIRIYLPHGNKFFNASRIYELKIGSRHLKKRYRPHFFACENDPYHLLSGRSCGC